MARHIFSARVRLARVAAATLLTALLGATSTGAIAQETVEFGAAPWPGVTVKTAVARQLLEALDYQTSSINAIDNDAYSLGDWELPPSSTAAMLARAGRSIDKKQWIVFLGWKPHWMNVKYNIRYLEDPKAIWGENTAVYTAINPEFADNNANVARFLKQMIVPSAIQSEWIYAYGYENKPADEVARQWIGSHVPKVSNWLKGVTTADGGKPAIAAIKAAFSP